MAVSTQTRRTKPVAKLTARIPAPPVKSLWVPPSLGDLTFVDMFCGAGGSSLGLTYAGFRLKVGLNHWRQAIDTHAANFTYAEHLCEDVSRYPLRRLPKADVLWASPICTEMSPAGGKAKKKREKVFLPGGKPAADGQGDMIEELGYVEAEGYEKTRATHWNVVEATEIFRYKVVITENVADLAEDWELFDIWIAAMCRLGYRVQIVSLNSALVGGDDNAAAPQWRDRIYCVFTRVDIPQPDLELCPRSVCPHCGDVDGERTWAPGTLKRVAAGDGRAFLVGRYRRIPGSSYGQYWFVCPNGCRGDDGKPQRVEPYVRPAAAAIDWSDLGGAIGDRSGDDVLEPNTISRIKAGMRKFAVPFTVNSNHDDTRVNPVHNWPLNGRTAKIGDGIVCPPMTVPCGGTWADDPVNLLGSPMRTQLANEKGCEAVVVPPFLTVLRSHADAALLDGPMPSVTTGSGRGGADMYLTTPPGAFYMMNYTAEPGKDARMCRDVNEPFGAQTASNSHSIVVPYYTKGVASTPLDPFGAVSTHDRFAVVSTVPADGWLREADIDELVARSLYRMLKPRESLRAQRFPDEYLVTGGVGAQTMQAGNAVSANCAQFLGGRVAAVLNRPAAPV